jgi:two-component system sensor histidine kinase KdpD
MIQTQATEGFGAILRSIMRYLGALAMVFVSTVVAFWIASRWGSAAVEMIYLPAVLSAAVLWGFGPSFLAAIASALAYNYYFTEPLHTFRINSAVDIVDVLVLFVVAIVTSYLASSIRRQARLADEHANRNATIAGFARRLLSSSTESEIVTTACEEISRIFACNCIVLSGLPQPRTIAAVPPGVPLTPSDIAAAVLALEKGEAAGHGQTQLGPAEWAFYPVHSDAVVFAAIGLSRDDGSNPVSENQVLVLESALDQVALAIERARSSTR